MPADRPEGSQGTYGADVYVQDGVVYPDEATAVVMRHPNIPDDLKRVYITKPDDKEDTTSSTMPLGSTEKLTGALELQPGTGVPLTEITSPEPSQGLVIPEPYGLNPPERGPGFEGPPRGEPKVLFKTSTGVEFTDHDIENAIHIASSFGTGTMAGVKSARAMNTINDLGHAQVLEAEGVHPDKILHDSGWFRGVDNRWRYEISDDKARLNEDWWDKEPRVDKIPTDPFEQVPFDRLNGLTTAKLPEVLDHPDLYKAYPHLKDIDVVKDPNVSTAHWDAANNEIVVGHEQYNTPNVFLHEIQHAIQTHEGFAEGAAYGQAGKTYALKYGKEADKQIIQPLRELYKKLTKPGAKATDAELIELDRLQTMAKKFNEYANAGDAKAMESYMNVAGEVEARNTEARMLLTSKERRSMHPFYTSDRDNPTINFEPIITTPYGSVKYK